MAARKRLALPRTMAVSTIRNGRLYFCLAAWRTISKSRLTSGCVSKSCSCGCCCLASACLLRVKLGRSPINGLPVGKERELTFGNIPNRDVVHAFADPGACHDDLLLVAFKR